LLCSALSTASLLPLLLLLGLLLTLPTPLLLLLLLLSLTLLLLLLLPIPLLAPALAPLLLAWCAGWLSRKSTFSGASARSALSASIPKFSGRSLHHVGCCSAMRAAGLNEPCKAHVSSTKE
jgi:hypothetical protein